MLKEGNKVRERKRDLLFPPCFHWLSTVVSIFPASLLPSGVSRSILSLCDSVNCNLPGPSVHGILQARTLEWVAVLFSRGSSQARDRSQVPCTAGRFFTIWATREVLAKVTVGSSHTSWIQFAVFLNTFRSSLPCTSLETPKLVG